MIFCKADREHAQLIRKTLEDLEAMSDLKINLEKSTVFFSRNSPHRFRTMLGNELNIRHIGAQDHYLGLPSTINRSKSSTFEFIITKVKNKLGGWKSCLLSRAGKATLIKSTLLAILVYAMACFLLLDYLTNEINSLCQNFWWRGTGDKKGKNPSWGWRSIIKGRDFIMEDMLWRVGSSSTLPVFCSLWIPTHPQTQIMGPNQSPSSPVLVAELFDRQMGMWNVHAVRNFFPASLADTVLNIEIQQGRETPIWPLDRSKAYTINSGYLRILDYHNEEATKYIKLKWRDIWKLQAAPKLHHFLWRFCRNSLSVRALLHERGVAIPSTLCSGCSMVDEIILHVFFGCPFAREVWRKSPIASVLNVNYSTPGDYWAKVHLRF
ncbi:hypothetical protein Cni_G05333 [Canna indica]|uniref:Reverse transcriptase zinc-binding domain-containing protein n=1 Tax=Canna indica TaxID=4628 RepID=A0AAQ3JXJ1_9LILI|nr:hypothetical protein Cni_G05333 [Canna indica]